MIPIGDVMPSRTTPWVTIGLVAANAAVFARLLFLPDAAVNDVYLTYGLIPAQFSWPDVVTSMFVHGSGLALATNLIALWIFGDNVEDRMGHGRFLLFYLLAGVVAALVQCRADAGGTLPLVGASGATAGVMGAYLVLFLHSRVLVLIYLVVFVDAVEVPAVFLMAIWLAFQMLGGLVYAGYEFRGDMAFSGHAVAFIAGAVTVWLFRRPERQEVAWWNG